MNSDSSMSVDNIDDIDMQRPDVQPEDAQTSHDAGLFEDDEDDDESGAGHFTDAVSQPPTTDAVSQPSTSAMPNDKRARDEVVPEKRRFHEVDYSQTLRETVYKQQERINRIMHEKEVIRQEAQDRIEEQRRLAEEERERHICDVNEKTWQWEAALREREREKQETHTWQEQQEAQLRKNVAEELAWHEAKISARKDQEYKKKSRGGEERPTRGIANDVEQLEERKNAIAEMERRLQLEIEKLKAEKESELANMEQRFARCTPCLETIKKIRKARRATCKVHLVSVAEDADADDPIEMHQERSPTVEQEPPQCQLNDAYPMSTMENAVSRGVEAALRRIFVDKDLQTSAKHSPRRKRKQDDEVRIERAAELSHERDFLLGEVRCLLKDTFSISQDADFIVHQPAIREDVYSYEYEDGPGPNTQNLAFNLEHGSSTPWNAKILDILLEELQRRSTEEKWPFQRSDGYYKAILEDRYKQLRMAWRVAQPKVTAKGILETGAEVEERLIAKRDGNLKLKYTRRAKILQHIIELKKDDEDEDLPAWQWLQKLIKTLGDDGMSSEESDVENDVECVLWVKNMTWRRRIEQELNVIDNQRVLDDNIFAPQGSKPMKRIRAPGNSMTVWSPVTGLPKALYDGKWFGGLTGGQWAMCAVGMYDESFPLHCMYGGGDDGVDGWMMSTKAEQREFGIGRLGETQETRQYKLSCSEDRGKTNLMSSTVQTVELIVGLIPDVQWIQRIAISKNLARWMVFADLGDNEFDELDSTNHRACSW
ncbi:hypothetical protein F4604DRAFT_1672841 [Suillus subluteus]|nr:hypothetical protein F4604DRAFT_1672841 [Suillus subluteus]